MRLLAGAPRAAKDKRLRAHSNLSKRFCSALLTGTAIRSRPAQDSRATAVSSTRATRVDAPTLAPLTPAALHQLSGTQSDHVRRSRHEPEGYIVSATRFAGEPPSRPCHSANSNASLICSNGYLCDTTLRMSGYLSCAFTRNCNAASTIQGL